MKSSRKGGNWVGSRLAPSCLLPALPPTPLAAVCASPQGRFGQGQAGGAPTCQRCLQQGHWTYECKNEPVYQSRPTRTQQLKNPRVRSWQPDV